MNSRVKQTNLPTIEELLAWARELITAYGAAAESVWTRLEDQGPDNELMEMAGELFVSTGMTTESIIVLIEHGLIWDATALFRSLLEGSARFCHLLSASSPEEERSRLHEFEEVLGNWEMANLSQRVSSMKKGPLYKNDETDAYLRHTEATVKEAVSNKSGEAGAVMSKWGFKKLSEQLCNECPEWKNMADLWEFRYSTANFSVHKSALSLMPDLLSWNRRLGPGNLLVQVWGPSLLSFCVNLVHTRIAVFMRRLDLDATVLRDVMIEHLSFSQLATAMELEASERWKKQVRSNGASTKDTGK